MLGPLGLTLAHNRGVAFGLAGGAGAPLVLVTLVALGVVGYLFARNPTRPGMWVAAGLLAGGAIGNLADRVRAGEVTDFVDLRPGRPSTSPTWRSPPASSCWSSSTCATPSGSPRVAEPELRIVHLDEALAVVDKPAGLVVHPAPSHQRPDPGRRARRHPRRRRGPGAARASSTASTRAPAACWSSPAATRPTRRCRRGPAPARSNASTWPWPAAGSAPAPARSTPRSAAPRASATGWRSPAPARARRAPTSRCWSCSAAESYLEAKLETGRTHQIRAHFAAIGHPLTGDATYGGARRYGLERQFLHAHRLAFEHPFSGERLELRVAAAGRPRRRPGDRARRPALRVVALYNRPS